MSRIWNRLLMIAFLFCTAMSLQAQSATFNDVLSVQLQNMGPILENNQVKGYYMFYKVDKVDRKNNAYMLRILDENLDEVAKKKMVKTKHTILTEAVYNGQAFLFSLLDYKKKKLELVTYNRAMKKLGSRLYELDKWGMTQYNFETAGPDQDIANNKIIFPIGDRGFVRYSLVKNKKAGYEIEYLPNDLKKSGYWMKGSPKDVKKVFGAGHGAATDRYLLSYINTRPKTLSTKNITTYLQMMDLQSKEIVFKKELKDRKHQYSYLKSFIHEESQKVMIFGEYYGIKQNIFKDKSKGIYAMELDLKGEIIKKELHPWTGQINKMVGVDKKGRIADGGYVAFHKIVQTVDGHYFAIGEMYKKAASALGIASQFLGGGTAMSKMVVLDLIIFDLNPDLSLNDVVIFEKKKQDVHLPQGAGYLTPSLMAAFIRGYGGFDYAYTQMNEDRSSFFSTYTSVEKDRGEVKNKKSKSKKKSKKGKKTKSSKKKKSYFGIIAYTEGDEDFVLDKIDLTTDAKRISVYPAKPGYILITEYYKKQKKLETRLEKINY